MFEFEEKAEGFGYDLVIGVDEAGRGPLAGPVVAGAVCLKSKEFTNPIRDSKKMTSAQIERAFVEIQQKAFVGVGVMSEAVIDQVNILEATFLAMNQAVERLIAQVHVSETSSLDFAKRVCLLIDGNQFKTQLPYKAVKIIKGDSKSFSISCASIVAKFTRDRILGIYDRVLPEYGFSKHKGYPTKSHKDAIVQFGPSLIQRKSFKY